MPGERILIVDDNSANVVLISFLLTTKGYEVRTAADAAEALATLRTYDPRMILMDVRLPGMDGLELTRRLKEDPATRHILVVALTAHAMKADEQRARDAGCDGYLSKPIDTRTLPATIARYLDRQSGGGDLPSPSPALVPPAVEDGAPTTEERAADEDERALILVVDDQAPNRALLRGHLAPRYRLREAVDGAAAMEILKNEPVDLVLLDVMMPHMSGFALCRVIKQRPDGAYLPVILITALGQHEDRITGLAAGADDFLTKPVSWDELSLRVQTFVKLRQQDRHIHRQLDELARRDRLIRNQLEELQALDSLKDELVSLLVHDMRNPLSGIAGFLDSLEHSASSGEKERWRADVRRARDASGRLRETLDDLLQVRLLESGTLRIHRELVEANALIQDAIASVRGAAHARQIQITAGDQVPGVQLVADRKLVRRAIENLLTNAVKYAPVGGVVSTVVRRTGSDIEFEIADRGVKIPDEFRDRLFHRFGSSGPTETGPGEDGDQGLPLGLYLVRLVATAHGGHAIARDQEGGGTALGFSLPVQQQPKN